MMRLFSKFRLIAFLAIAIGVTTAFPAMANLSITPTIVVIEGRERYADVYLVNPTEELTNYEINWRFFKMKEGSGDYDTATTSTTPWDLTKHIVFTPRRVAIEPEVAQKIRLGLRLGGEPPAPGDYRAHLEFMKVGDDAPGVRPLPDSQKIPGKATAKVGVNMNVGFSIPVIYRVGESDATAKIGDVKTSIDETSGKIKLHVPITKSKSAYGIAGDIKVWYKDEMIGQVRNANIFAEINHRDFNVSLTKDKLAGGELKIVYSDFSKEKNITYDEKTIPVGQ